MTPRTFSLLGLLFVVAVFPCLAAADSVPEACAAATAAVQVVGKVTAEGSIAHASGTWQSSGGATGAMIELRIDSDRLQAEWQAGKEGTWDMTQAAAGGCGRHTLRVFAYPTVARGAAQVECLERGSSAAQNFQVSCAPAVESLSCTWDCSAGATCTGTCTGAGIGGRAPYRVVWSVAGAERPGPTEPGHGPWAEAFTCAPGAPIVFKVRNAFGAAEWSKPAEVKCGEAAARP
jgi:hypothetical protein